ncbi:transglutaminase family protein [Spirulina sp. CS-785/01]|uniref:transglutaminase family protein n=1 Tax=Spirulina sp. CS-785/01 TaxID=3021716 RepID=UPI00232ED82D|nr:transglutaminase family protein [Spirulina sp. CS-785/01]MDB9314263.1 transglutaminase family protein [Spirulina sp. CS-785/01]
MYYQICHRTTYSYSQKVSLRPHVLRLHPRSDAWQNVYQFQLAINPQPENISHYHDLDGNYLIKIWFKTLTESLECVVKTEVETRQENPFNYLLNIESWAKQFPFDYPSSLQQQLQPYLRPYQTVFDPDIITLAQEIAQNVGHDPKQFLNDLNQHIYSQCNYIFRETGQPQSAGITWQQKEGSCRDLAVLFMEVCRVMGLASRFVSGYQEGDPDMQEWDLHAWAEIYLPGAGWRGYDPSQGLIVSDRHIALVASAIPTYTAPIAGDYIPATVELAHPVQSRLNNKITIRKLAIPPSQQ